MALIQYTAKRSLLPNHNEDEVYTVEIQTTASRKSRKVEKVVKRSMGGAMETLYHRADVEYQITFEPVRGVKLQALQEFLDSTESGEAFALYLYGTESNPISLKRTDEGYDWQEFMPVGSESGDWFQATISAVQL